MEVVAAAPRCQLLLIVLMAAMLLPGMKGSPLLVWRKIAKTIKLQGSIGKVTALTMYEGLSLPASSAAFTTVHFRDHSHSDWDNSSLCQVDVKLASTVAFGDFETVLEMSGEGTQMSFSEYFDAPPPPPTPPVQNVSLGDITTMQKKSRTSHNEKNCSFGDTDSHIAR
ncbi:hypothetical protein STEG23_009412 [Scotinomys teguina]